MPIHAFLRGSFKTVMKNPILHLFRFWLQNWTLYPVNQSHALIPTPLLITAPLWLSKNWTSANPLNFIKNKRTGPPSNSLKFFYIQFTNTQLPPASHGKWPKDQNLINYSTICCWNRSGTMINILTNYTIEVLEHKHIHSPSHIMKLFWQWLCFQIFATPKINKLMSCKLHTIPYQKKWKNLGFRETLHFKNKTFYLGGAHLVSCFRVMGKSNWLIAKNKIELEKLVI
jgi:hypothetical protein